MESLLFLLCFVLFGVLHVFMDLPWTLSGERKTVCAGGTGTGTSKSSHHLWNKSLAVDNFLTTLSLCLHQTVDEQVSLSSVRGEKCSDSEKQNPMHSEMWVSWDFTSFLKRQWTMYSEENWACDPQGTGFSASNWSPVPASSPNTPHFPLCQAPHAEIFLKNWEADCWAGRCGNLICRRARSSL